MVVDTSGQPRAAADNAAAALADVTGYAFESSLNAYRNWPPGPITGVHEPTRDTDEDYGPNNAHCERVLGAALDDRFLTTRAGLRRALRPAVPAGWWLDRIAAGGHVVVPTGLDLPMSLIDARDLAGWLVESVERRISGAKNTTGSPGMTTSGGLLEICRAVTGGDVERMPVSDADLIATDVQPWQHLPLWFPAELARTAWDVDTSRARQLGLPSRPVRGSVADTWAWMRTTEPPQPPPGRAAGVPPELEAALLSDH